jgi:hypothetical protein
MYARVYNRDSSRGSAKKIDVVATSRRNRAGLSIMALYRQELKVRMFHSVILGWVHAAVGIDLSGHAVEAHQC